MSPGGILVLPTGGGKTFTAVRFLCAGPLSQGYKILWLAHTHHLLEQALESLEREVGRIAEPKSKLRVRVVSGTLGHCRVHEIKPTDDVLICTLQTLVRAHNNKHPQLRAFLQQAGEKLCVVFDEAHHAPAYSYRTLITSLRENQSGMALLGLTATPTHTDEQKRGWLKQLFPQEILYQVATEELMAIGILAKPVFEDHRTEFSAEFDERDYQMWCGTSRDLPEEIITQLAQSRERNQFIAQTYVDNKQRYGKTIIFANRWFQCEQLHEFIIARDGDIRVDVVYTHINADPGSPEARRRATDENKQVLERFRRGELDVLINIRMLTEGTDVPDVNTVFLTRQTTSSILVTQMIGRALRGPNFGGTEEAYIVSFIDDWKHLIHWVDYTVWGESPATDLVPEYAKQPLLQLVSIDLVRHIARQMDSGLNIERVPFVTLMPIGWYSVKFDALVGGSDDLETVQQMIMVFDTETEYYQQFIAALGETSVEPFVEPAVTAESQIELLEAWQQRFFSDVADRVGSDLLINLFRIARHVAQNEAEPTFFPFEERTHHDLDAVAQQFIDADTGARAELEALQVEYRRADRYWSHIYPNLGLFKSQYDACKNRILFGPPVPHSNQIVVTSPELRIDREPSSELKEQVKARDHYRCLSCGEDNKRSLQIDHVAPFYVGGNNSLGNLQTLCRVCNQHKSGINEINFRNHSPLRTQPPVDLPALALPPLRQATETEEWERFLRRSINFFYDCAAVDVVKIGKRRSYFYHWKVRLYAGNAPRWLEPHLCLLLQQINERRGEAGRQRPTSISIAAPDVPSVRCTLQRF